MNKWEKEVQQSLLNDEQQVLKILKMAYADTLRDVEDRMSGYFARITANPNDTSAIYQYRYQQALQGQLQDILDNLQQQNYQTISDYLNHSYENGYLGAMYDIHRQGIPIITPINQENVVRAITINSKISVPMYTRLGTDINLLKTAIAGEVTRGIASGSMWHDVASRIADKTGISSYNAMRIARTEGHRVQCNAQYDACQSAKQSGADVVNQWDSTMDNRTRDTHRRLHGQLREVGYPFEIDGMTADYPGAFGIPSEDIHCRCAMLQRARWALSPDELAQLQNTSEAKQLAQTADFEEFKNKYLELTEKLPYSGDRGLTSPLESGTIESSRGLPNPMLGAVLGSAFVSALNVSDAETYARDVLGIPNVSYQGISVEIANEWNRGLYETFEKFPELRKQFGFVGTCQERNRMLETVVRQGITEQLLANNPTFTKEELTPFIEAQVQQHLNKLPISPDALAQSYSPALEICASMRGISINADKCQDIETLKNQLKMDVERKFRPLGCDSIRGLLDHEIGHQLDKLLGIRELLEIQVIFDSYSNSQIEEGLSRYAWNNGNPNKYAEAIAEAWAEYCNNPEPRQIAEAVGKIIEKAYREKFNND